MQREAVQFSLKGRRSCSARQGTPLWWEPFSEAAGLIPALFQTSVALVVQLLSIWASVGDLISTRSPPAHLWEGEVEFSDQILQKDSRLVSKCWDPVLQRRFRENKLLCLPFRGEVSVVKLELWLILYVDY